MKKEITNPETSKEYVTKKPWKPIVLDVKHILRTKVQMLEKLNQID